MKLEKQDERGPDRVVMLDDAEEKVLVSPEQSLKQIKQNLLEKRALFETMIIDLERAIEIANQRESLMENAKQATKFVTEIYEILSTNSVDDLVANDYKRKKLENNLNGCREFMNIYISTMKAIHGKLVEDTLELSKDRPFIRSSAVNDVNHPDFMDSAFVNKAIGVAAMVLGAITSLLGALAMAVSLGAITTGVLAPLGVIGANVSTGMMTGGIMALAFGAGFFAHGRNMTHKSAQEPLSENQLQEVSPD